METQQFVTQLSRFCPLPAEFRAEIEKSIRKELYFREQIIQDEKSIADRVWFVEKGLVMQYFLKEEKKIPRRFWKEGEIITDIQSLLTQKPSGQCIEIQENSVLQAIDYEQLQSWQGKFPEAGILVSSFIKSDKNYENWLTAFQSKPSVERYHQLLKTMPQVFTTIPVDEVSAFLRISTSNLKRIKGIKKSK